MRKRWIFAGLGERPGNLSWFLISLLLIVALVVVLHSTSPHKLVEAASSIFLGATPTPHSPPPVITTEPAILPVPTSELASLPVWASPTPLPPLSASIPGQFSVQNITLGQAAPLNAGLANHFGHVGWSPDGQMLAFSLSKGRINAGGWTLTDIALVSAEGKDVQSLAPGFIPKWSPDGNLIAYLAYSDDLTNLYVRVVDVESRQVTEVTSIQRDGVFPILAWLSATELLYFQDDLMLFDYATGQKSKLLESVPSVSVITTETPLKYLATDPEQGLIVAASKEVILILQRDGKEIHLLKQLPEGVDNEAMAISPDGSALVYVSAVSQQVKIVPTRGDAPAVELPWASRGTAWSVAWSPDGASLVYVDADGVHMVNRDGSGLRRIQELSAGILRLAWSPQGTSLILSQDSGLLLNLPVLVNQ